MHLKMPRTYHDYHKKKLNTQENFESWSVLEDMYIVLEGIKYWYGQ